MDVQTRIERLLKIMRIRTLLWFVAGILLSLFSLGCNFPLLSYPRYWDFTKTRPKDADVVGTYELANLRLSKELAQSVREKTPMITLNADHIAVLTDVPGFDVFGRGLTCRLSGSASWALDDGMNSGEGWSIVFQNYHATKPTNGKCDYQTTKWSVLILGRHSPHRLYDMIGDPDSDTGVEYGRIKP
jgi:hypothetical protein